MKQPTRRWVLAGGVAATATGLSPFVGPSPAQAAAPPLGRQAPGFYRYRVGSFEVTVVTDGARTQPLPDNYVRNATKEEVNAALSARFGEGKYVTAWWNPNLYIDYKLVDNMAGHTVKSSVVLEGRITADDVQDLAESLEFGEILDPRKAGFPDLAEKMPSSWVENDGAVHVLTRISYTSNPAPDYLPTTDQFLASVVDYSLHY